MNKKCTKCEEVKDVGEFYARKTSKDGLNSRCKSCVNQVSRDQYKGNSKERVEYARKYREAHREEGREYAKNYRKENSEEIRRSNAKTREERRFLYSLRMSLRLAKRHGYEPCNATVGEIGAAFRGRCEICGVPELECSHRLAMDHDHMTGDLRGFLCGNCNRMLGLARESEEILINGLHYLMSHSLK